MATRTVTVELEAKVIGFQSGMREAKASTSDLNDELDDLGKHDREFDALEKRTAGVTVSTKEAAKATDGLGEQLKQTGADARFLSAELAKTRREVEELAAAFALTGDPDTLAKYKKQKSYLSQLTRLAKDVAGGDGSASASGPEAAGADIGKKVGTSAVKSFTAVFGEGLASPATWIVAGAALAPVGVALGGAILTGIGLAGIAAGVAGQIDNPLVQEAGSRLGQKVGSGFTEATEVFAKPVAELLDGLGKEWDRLALGLKTTFGYLADEIPTLGEGVNGFLDAFIPGMERAAVAAMPLVDTFAHWLPQFGAELAFLFDEMASHADEANDGLKLLLGTISAIIAVADAGIVVFSALFDALKWTTPAIGALIAVGDAGGEASKHLDVAANSTAAAAARAKEAAPSYAELSKRLKDTAVTADTLAGEMVDKVINTFLAADEATLGLAESQTRLADTLKENGRAFDIHSAKGQANREAILSVVRANLQMYDTMISAGYSAEQAAKSYDDNTAALEAQLRKAKFTNKQINDLIGSYRNVPGKVDTAIAVNGLTDAINDLNDLLRLINHLPPRKQVVIETVHVDRFNRIAQRWGGVHYAADGLVSFGGAGIYSGGPVYGIAEPETGGEAFVPRFGDYARSMGILSEAASWYGAAVQPLARSRAAAGIWPAGGASGTAGDDHSVHLTVQAARANLDYSELQAWQRNAEIRQRVGRPR
jgi:hypothetical protein